jgi:hypothetical protein
MKICLMAVIGIALSGCASSVPRIDPARLEALSPGQTTTTDVVRQFGRPSLLSKNPDGTQTAVYKYGDNKAIVPLIAGTPSDSVVFYFDINGVMTDYKTTEAKTISTTPVPVGAGKPAPDAAKVTTTVTTKTTNATTSTTPIKNAPVNNSEFFPGATTQNR